MKRSTLYILGGVLVLLILLTASCACCDFKPHSKKVRFTKYEGMEGGEGEEGEEEMNDEGDEELLEEGDEEVEGFGFPYEGIVEEMGDEGSDDEESEDADEMVEESMINKMKRGLGLDTEKEGLQNLGPCPYNDESMCGKYDIYGPPTKGSLDCGAQSAGLSNSKGPLCLSQKQRNLLSTRGNNATTDSQIGA